MSGERVTLHGANDSFLIGALKRLGMGCREPANGFQVMWSATREELRLATIEMRVHACEKEVRKARNRISAARRSLELAIEAHHRAQETLSRNMPDEARADRKKKARAKR